MIHIDIDKPVYHRLAQRVSVQKELNNSITKGKGNYAGGLGEVLAKYIYGGDLTNLKGKSYDYDLILPDNRTADVKTKITTVAPQMKYEASVSDFNTKQKCDLYIFCRVKDDYTEGWVIGHISKKEFYEAAWFRKKGHLDESNNQKASCDSYNIYHHQLEPPLIRKKIQPNQSSMRNFFDI